MGAAMRDMHEPANTTGLLTDAFTDSTAHIGLMRGSQ